MRLRGAFSLGEIASQYLADMSLRVAPKTLKEARHALERIFRETHWTEIDEVSREGINRWRAARMTAGTSNRTINRQVGELKAALALALNDRLIEHNPLDGLRPLSMEQGDLRRRSRSLSKEQAEKLINAAKAIDAERPAKFPCAPLLATFFATGARWHELVATTWGDLDEQRSTLRFRASTTKTRKERRFPLKRETLAKIVALRAEHVRVTRQFPTAQSRIFLAPRGGVWPKDTARFHRFFREAMRRAGIDHTDSDGRVFHIHACRPARRS